MSTTRTFLKNASTRHSIFVQRFAGGQYRQMLPFLKQVRQVVLGRLAQVDITNLTKKQLNETLAEIDKALSGVYGDMGDQLMGNLQEFANYEAEFSQKLLNKATVNANFKKPSQRLIEAAVFSKAIDLTKDTMPIESALQSFSKAKRRNIINVIRNGIVQGRTQQEMTRDINQLVTHIDRNHASALVSTLTNHVSTSARQALFEENADVISGVEWVSTLDGSTTHTCQSLDGQFFEENKGPRPPLHWGCRSTVIPKVKEEYRISDLADTERPAVGSDGVEIVKGTTTYNSWLKTQSAEFQDEVLGATKGKLFREGGLSVKNFVDRNYEPLTLEQLRRKEPLAFKKAGLIEDE